MNVTENNSDVLSVEPDGNELTEEFLDDLNLDEKQKGAIMKAVSVQFSGPLPLPSILAKYNDIIPDGADRILKMAESEQGHRQEIEKRCVGIDSRDSLVGMTFGLILCICLIVGGVIIALLAKSNAGTIMGALLSGTSMAGILKVFLGSSNVSWKQNSKNIEKSLEKRTDEE